jgi:hypothetical protein
MGKHCSGCSDRARTVYGAQKANPTDHEIYALCEAETAKSAQEEAPPTLAPYAADGAAAASIFVSLAYTEGGDENTQNAENRIASHN